MGASAIGLRVPFSRTSQNKFLLVQKALEKLRVAFPEHTRAKKRTNNETNI
jgi:hypothetical protein